LIIAIQGVCDCCDGQDERDSPFNVTCPDTCTHDAASVQQALVTQYQSIRSGLRARSKVVDALRRQKFREQQTLENLENEWVELKSVAHRINSWKYREEWKEFWMRWKVLRAFESECAGGVHEACHIQEEGVRTEYAVFGSIIGGGYEGIPQGDEAAEAAGKQRRADERQRRRAQGKKDSSSSLTGRARVMASECPRMSYEIVTEGRVARSLYTLSEYLTFMEGAGGTAVRTFNVERSIRQTSLFSAVLDNGSAGYTLALQLLSEAIGVVMSVHFTLPLWLIQKAAEGILELVWGTAVVCASSAAADGEFEVDEGSGYGSGYAGLAGAFWKKYSPVVKTMCTVGALRSTANLITDVQKEGSPSFNAMAYLDFTQYDLAVKAYEVFLSYTETARWIFFIAYRAPAVYAKFFYTSLVKPQTSLLPVKRDACTLREAEEVVRDETAQISEQIRIARERISGGQPAKAADAAAGSSSKKARVVSKKDNEEDVSLDPNRFGPNGEWEAVDQSCISKTDSPDGYMYDLCLFGKLKQGSTLIGRYDGWISDNRDSNSALKQNLIENGASAELQYGRYMRYTNGDYCYAAKRNRYANVRFVCSESTSILRIQEFEVNFLFQGL
jgi:hypothetical protein